MLDKTTARDAQDVDDDESEFIERDEHERPKFTAHTTWGDPRDLPTRDWVYGRYRLIGSVSATIADGGVGKTTLALTEAIAMATGRDFLGERPNALSGPLLERRGSLDEIERRVYAICQHYGIDPKRELSGRGLSTARCMSRRGWKCRFASPVAARAASTSTAAPSRRSPITSASIALSSSSSIRSSLVIRSPENDNAAINAVVRQLARLAANSSIIVDLVHHTRKPLQGGGAKTPSPTRAAHRR